MTASNSTGDSPRKLGDIASRLLFENQRALSDENLTTYATDLGLDVEAFTTCYTSGKFKDDVQKDAREGGKIGVTGTPAFFVNGRFLSGAQPFDSFKAIIDDELGG